MKLIAADVVLLIAGLLLLGGATTGLIATGGLSSVTSGGSPSGLFNVTYASSSKTVGDKAVSSFASGSQEFDVTLGNVSKVVVTVRCALQQTPPAGASYTVSVSIAGPNVTNGPTNVACNGQARDIPIDITPMPKGGTVAGNSEDDARKNLGPNANATKAMGKWTVQYRGSWNVPSQVPIGGSLPQGSGNIVLKADQWTPSFVAVTR